MTDIFPELANVERIPEDWQPPIRRIQIDVCREYGIALDAMLGDSKLAVFVGARREAVRRAFHETSASMTAIARAFRCHHSSIVHLLGRKR
jgi:chromosomal replication initiation ATPase DnaA